ncbi:unnamed protein product, partial [Ectocarpus fasciculatus]
GSISPPHHALGGNEQLAHSSAPSSNLLSAFASFPAQDPCSARLRNGVPPAEDAGSDRGALAQFRLPCGYAEWRKRSYHPGYRHLRRRSWSLRRGAGRARGGGSSSSSTKHVRRASMGRGLGIARSRRSRGSSSSRRRRGGGAPCVREGGGRIGAGSRAAYSERGDAAADGGGGRAGQGLHTYGLGHRGTPRINLLASYHSVLRQ